MDNAELLSHFESRVDEFEKIRGFIEKAKGQASKFAASVVEKVIRTNTEKTDAIVEELIPLMGDMDAVVESLESAKADIVEGQQQSRLLLEELELRLLIQELTEEQFESDSVGLKKELSETDEKIAEIDSELLKFRSQLDRWQSLGEDAGLLSSSESSETAEESVAEEVEIEEVDVEENSVDSDEESAAAEPESAESDDFDEVVFDDDEELIEVDGFEDESPEASEVEINQVDAQHATEDLTAVLDDGDDVDDIEELEAADEEESIELEMGEARQAVLIYSEGNSDEQVYPLNGDALRLGRGRDNDIQVKNDSKVSRYHCRVYGDDEKFFIEDNKSANGTLVNDESVDSSRQLFGGEKLTIGETEFYFRILA